MTWRLTLLDSKLLDGRDIKSFIIIKLYFLEIWVEISNSSKPTHRYPEAWVPYYTKATTKCSLTWRKNKNYLIPLQAVACGRVGGTECGSACMGPFEGGRHYLHYLHHSLAPGKQQGGNIAPPSNRKLNLKIYWAWKWSRLIMSGSLRPHGL